VSDRSQPESAKEPLSCTLKRSRPEELMRAEQRGVPYSDCQAFGARPPTTRRAATWSGRGGSQCPRAAGKMLSALKTQSRRPLDYPGRRGRRSGGIFAGRGARGVSDSRSRRRRSGIENPCASEFANLRRGFSAAPARRWKRAGIGGDAGALVLCAQFRARTQCEIGTSRAHTEGPLCRALCANGGGNVCTRWIPFRHRKGLSAPILRSAPRA